MPCFRHTVSALAAPLKPEASPSSTYHWEPASHSITQHNGSAGSRCICQHCCSNANCLSNHSTSQCHKPLLKPYLVLPRLQQGKEQQQSFCSSPAAYDAITPRHPPQHFGNCQQEAPHGKSHPSQEREGGATSLELYPIVLAVQLWGNRLASCSIPTTRH